MDKLNQKLKTPKMKYFFISLALLLPILSTAQDSNLGNWLLYIGNKKLNSKWNWHHEVQYRNYNAVGDLEQLLLRTGIGYNLTPTNGNLLLGYGFIHSQNYTGFLDLKQKVNEHRVFQQLITRDAIGRVGIQHRYRFEQRWIEDTDFKMRFRYFLSLNVPLNHTRMQEKTWYASAYNEIFLNHKQIIFDRNRLYLGLGFRLNKMAKFELGYMNQFLNNRNSDQINMVTFLSF